MLLMTTDVAARKDFDFGKAAPVPCGGKNEVFKTHTCLFAHLFEGVPLAKMIDDFEV